MKSPLSRLMWITTMLIVVLAAGVWADTAATTRAVTVSLSPLAGPRETVLYCLRFSDYDANGSVTLEEAQSVLPWMCDHRFTLLDRNSNDLLDAGDTPAFPDTVLSVISLLLPLTDADGDEYISQQEVSAVYPDVVPGVFYLLDRNRDNRLSYADSPPLQNGVPQTLSLVYGIVDADFSGTVTFAELGAWVPGLTQEMYDSLDLDQDDLITPFDLPTPVTDPRAGETILLAVMDANRNGQVEVSEFRRYQGGSTEAYVLLDADGNGVWTLSDVAANPLPSVDADHIALVQALLGVDVLSDDVLEFSEVARVYPDAPLTLMTALDLDGNGVLERWEILSSLGYSTSGTRLIPAADANGDGVVNSIDIQLVVNQTLGLADTFLEADLSQDGKVNSADIQVAVRATLTKTSR